MSYSPFNKLCKYYIDCIIEDNSDNISAFAESKNPTYTKLKDPELTERNPVSLTVEELSNFHNIYKNQTRGNQKKSWWYGYALSYHWVKSNKSGWQGRVIKPILYVPVEIGDNNNPILTMSLPRLNFDALKDWDIEPQEARILSEELGLIDNSDASKTLKEFSNELRRIYPDLDYDNNDNKSDTIQLKGAIFCSESSPFTQGVEAELNKLKDVDKNTLARTSIKVFFPEINTTKKVKEEIENIYISDVFKLNDEQHKVLSSVFKNDLTVVTGPPGTGKSQLVASIITNAARNNQRVLFVSKNHKAVDVVEERLNKFSDRPFIIRLGSKDSNDRDLKNELISYLNSLLGNTANNIMKTEHDQIINEISTLRKQQTELKNEIESYRKFRNNLNNLSKDFTEKVIHKIGIKESTNLLNHCKENQSFISKLLCHFSPRKKITQKYFSQLNSISNNQNFEYLCEELDKIENTISEKSKIEFKLWLDTLPLRLDPNKRRLIAEYVSVLKSFIEAGNDTSKKAWAQLFSKRETIMKEVTGFLPAWCITNLSAKGSLPFIDGFFDILVIDEASQCDIPSALPLMYRAKKVVVIGDPNQLQHITGMSPGRSLTLMNNYDISDTGYSIFEYTGNSLYHCSVGRIGENNITMLKEHFRSHSDIINFSNAKWYNNSLTVETDYNKLISIGDITKPKVAWVDIRGNIKQEKSSGAYIEEECNKVSEIAEKIVKDPNFKGEIGIVTPFRLQANKIRQLLITKLTDHEWARTNLLVDTTTKFQGDERDVIVFSPVVANNMPRGVRYYLESTPNLFNVSITRARAKLIVVGNNNACLNCGVAHIKDFAVYVNGLIDRLPNPGNENLQFESEYEKILHDSLLQLNIKTIPQYSIDQFRLDLAYTSNGKKIDIEVDGVTFHTDWTGEVLKRDIIRNLRLQKLGWKVLRFWAYEIRDNLSECVSKIQKEIL